jgi:hypothetical protein
MLDITSGVLQSATGTLKTAWSATGPQFSQHIADISKGVLIIVVGGLAAGVLLSLVSAPHPGWGPYRESSRGRVQQQQQNGLLSMLCSA